MIFRALALAARGILLYGQNFADVRPSPQQLAWQDLEIGVLIHFGPNTFQNQEWGDGTASPSLFNPTALDAGQWVTAARAGGAKYMIMVAKHHDGFCLWPSAETQYSVAASPWRQGKGDVVREVADACRKHGMRFGTYLSPWDRHEPSYRENAAYDKHYSRQLVELATRYGPLTEFWLDGAGSEGHVYDFERYIRNLRVYQANALIFASVDLLPWADIRWVGNEDGSAPEENWNVIDAYKVIRWRPAEADTPLRQRHWFWHPDDEQSLKSLTELLDTYHKTVGRGAQLVLGLAPDNQGLMPASDAARLKEFGAALRRIYGKDLADGKVSSAASPAAGKGASTYWKAAEGETRLELIADLGQPARIDRSLIMERLTEGQRVQSYQVDAWEAGSWKTVAQGTTIGHKKIDLFEPVTTAKMRLRIEEALGPPAIRKFQLFDGR
jgi:alpha-L-fucosidase